MLGDGLEQLRGVWVAGGWVADGEEKRVRGVRGKCIGDGGEGERAVGTRDQDRSRHLDAELLAG